MIKMRVGGTTNEQVASNEQERTDGVITVVLTADNHLGYAEVGHPPRKREERQQRLRRAFQQATDFAIGQGVDLFIQAGDLFDTTTPDERDRSFVAARLAQLRQAGIRTFAIGGVQDTPADSHSLPADVVLSPQMSYARLGALHYFAPSTVELEPVLVDVRGVLVGICGLGVVAGQQGNPLARMHVQDDIERATIRLLLLHAPIEGLTSGASLLDTSAQVTRNSIEKQDTFRCILAGYHHTYRHLHMGKCDVIVAGATQHIDFRDLDACEGQASGEGTEPKNPGFVFLGLAADGVRWCELIGVDALSLRRLVIRTSELWSNNAGEPSRLTTDMILERLQPLCREDALVQLRFEGELTRGQYHQLDLNQIRRYGEEHCFALAIDDRELVLLPTGSSPVNGVQVDSKAGRGTDGLRRVERFSPREELVALANEWIAAATNPQEQKALRATKEELLAALDEVKMK